MRGDRAAAGPPIQDIGGLRGQATGGGGRHLATAGRRADGQNPVADDAGRRAHSAISAGSSTRICDAATSRSATRARSAWCPDGLGACDLPDAPRCRRRQRRSSSAAPRPGRRCAAGEPSTRPAVATPAPAGARSAAGRTSPAALRRRSTGRRATERRRPAAMRPRRCARTVDAAGADRYGVTKRGAGRSERCGQSGWPTTLTTTPFGSRTKKRRGPHGSSVSGWTIS